MGGTLAEHGHEVWLIHRSQARADAINAHGLTLHTGERVRTVAIHAATDTRAVGSCELVLVLAKSFDTESVMQHAAAVLGPDTLVLSLQNGVGHEAVLARFVPTAQIALGKTYVGGQLLGLNDVIAGTEGKLTLIGELDGTLSPRILRVAQVFSAAGLTTQACENIQGVIWDKVLVNAATGAVSTISGLPYGELYQCAPLERIALAAVAEGMAVARAMGVTLSIREPRDAWVRAGTGLPYEFKPSMLQSIERGTITEIDYINGAIVQAGQRLGVPTPVNETLVACVKGIERRVEVTRRG